MKKDTNILNLLGFEGFIKNIDDNNLLNEQSIFVKQEVQGKVLIDSVYFSGNYASIYFKSITDFNKDSLKQICNIHKTIWNQRKVPFLYVSTPTELRAYNCFKEPVNPDTELEKLNEVEIKRYSLSDTEEHLQNLVNIFGKASIDSGEIWKNAELTIHFNSTKRVDDKLVQNLKETKLQLEKHNIPVDIIHNLLTRSLFILYLEDIKATDNGYYKQFKKNATSYFYLLSDKNATYELYEALEEKFNGDLFSVSETELDKVKKEGLEIIASCFWGNELKTGQQVLWKIFDFSVIPIELLSEIYEIFLNKTDKEKSKSGEYYTPHSLVDLILNESLPWASNENTKYDLTVLDLACGSGIFLVESYRRLVDRWIYTNKQQPEFDDLKSILLKSIYGFEVNPSSIKVAAFSLYLALISYLDPKTIWQQKTTKFPNLIFDPNRKDLTRQGQNLFLQSSLSNTIGHQPKFDLIVGNPPFKSAKTGSLPKEIQYYCRKYGFAQEMVLPFLHRANEFCSKNGKVSIVSTSKILFNKQKPYQNFRKFLFNKTYVDAIFNFSALRKAKKGQGRKVFADAVGPSCVLFYKKEVPKQTNQNITYVCPKPTERDRFSDSIVLDELDFFYLPRHECEKPKSVIWKVGMWGTENDFHLINKLSQKKTIKTSIIQKKGWYSGGGFQFLSKKREKTFINNKIGKYKIMTPSKVSRYYTNENRLINLNESLTEKNIEYYLNHYSCSVSNLPVINEFRMEGELKAFNEPHIFIKKGQSEGKFTASFVDYYCPYKDGIYSIAFDKDGLKSDDIIYKTNILKALTAILNSKFVSYYLFLTSSSWGVEREQIMFDEIKSLPFEISEKKITELAKKVDEILEELSKDYPVESITEQIENEIDKLIYKALNLTEREQFLVEDVLNYSLDLFQEGENSPAYFPVNKYNTELKSYLQILCEDINEHFEFSGTTVWASIQEMPTTNPMRLVAIHFTNEYKKGHIETFQNSPEVNKLISKIDKYSYEKHSASVYFCKVVKYYEGDIIYIIKPNQKRFWSCSQAMQDSQAILLEMANMEEE